MFVMCTLYLDSFPDGSASIVVHLGRGSCAPECDLGQEEYGIDIQKVQEIHGYESINCIANAPDFTKGMRAGFNLDTPTYGQFTLSSSSTAAPGSSVWFPM
jgi:hypothetical protein